MRTVASALSNAIASGYAPYFNCKVYTTILYGEYEPLNFQLTGLTLEITLPGEVPVSTDLVTVKVVLERGAIIAGTPTVISTSEFTVISGFLRTMDDGSYSTSLFAHLIPPVYIDIAADGSYAETIELFVAELDFTASFKDEEADFWDYQFYPDDQNFTKTNAQDFLTELIKKRFIYCCDNGDNDILFYCALETPDDYDYTHTNDVTPYIGVGIPVSRRFSAVDEFYNPRTAGTATDPEYDLGFVAALDSLPDNFDQPTLFEAKELPADLKYQDGDYVNWNSGQATIFPLRVVETFISKSPHPFSEVFPSWRCDLYQLEYFKRESGSPAILIVSELPLQGDFNGQTAYNTTNNKYYVWIEGTGWIEIGEGVLGPTPRLLESGDYRLLENGDIRLCG